MEASGADGCAKGSPRVAAGLTQAGTLLGTPVFMAPELWRGEAATTCSDVYALGAMLYQLGAGRLPYDADEQEALAQQVQERDAPPLASVAPGISPRLAAIIDRCLCRDPRHRTASGEELCAELEHLAGWQVLRRRLAWAATAGLALVLLLSIAGNALLGWVKTRRAVAVYLAEAATAHEQAHRQNLALAALRGQAFAAFDGRRIQDGERLWSQVKTLSAECYQTYQRAGQLLETALFHAPREQEIRRRIAENLYEQAEIFDRDHRLQQRDDALARLDSHAVDGQVGAIVRRWREPGVVSLATTPAGASVEVAQYEPGVAGSLTLRPLRTFGPTPILELRLAPGSYLLLLRAAGRSEVRVPLVVHHGERVTLDVALPHRTAVPPGFLYVPAGRFLFGVAGEERLRSLLGIVPLHERRLEAYLIAKTETTFGDWIEFLDALPRQQREAHRPHSGEQTAQGGQFGLQSTPDGSWTITLGPTDQQRHTARLGEPIVYAGRERRASVDWRQLPVVGIDLSDAQAYLSWLGSTGRVPGARLCTEAEWERAARGADDRQYPHGDLLNPDDANFDLTYRQNGLAMGPDEVGSHPASRSPFGIDDLTGNVWEWTESSLATGQFVLRGGAYYYDKVTVLSFNRETVGKSTRNQRLGLRVCAPAPITR